MTSLREQVEKRIAEFDGIYCDDRARPEKRLAALAIKTELSEVLTLIDEKAKELLEKESEYALAYKLELDGELKQNYLGRKLTYSHALSLLVGNQKDGESR